MVRLCGSRCCVFVGMRRGGVQHTHTRTNTHTRARTRKRTRARNAQRTRTRKRARADTRRTEAGLSRTPTRAQTTHTPTGPGCRGAGGPLRCCAWARALPKLCISLQPMSSYSVSRRHEPMSRNVRRKCGIGSIRPMISTLCSLRKQGGREGQTSPVTHGYSSPTAMGSVSTAVRDRPTAGLPALAGLRAAQ